MTRAELIERCRAPRGAKAIPTDFIITMDRLPDLGGFYYSWGDQMLGWSLGLTELYTAALELGCPPDGCSVLVCMPDGRPLFNFGYLWAMAEGLGLPDPRWGAGAAAAPNAAEANDEAPIEDPEVAAVARLLAGRPSSKDELH